MLFFIFPKSDHWLASSMSQLLSCYLDLSKKYGFLYVVTHVDMDLLKLLLGFVTVLLCISCPLPNETKLKFDQDFKAC